MADLYWQSPSSVLTDAAAAVTGAVRERELLLYRYIHISIMYISHIDKRNRKKAININAHGCKYTTTRIKNKKEEKKED